MVLRRHRELEEFQSVMWGNARYSHCPGTVLVYPNIVRAVNLPRQKEEPGGE